MRCDDSKEKGNYNSKGAIPTGSVEAYAVNNIYDMAGNIFEWTMERENTNARVVRGGHFGNSFATTYSASSRSRILSPSNISNIDGCRLALYI